MTHNRLGRRFQRRLDVPVWLERGPQGESYSDRVLNIQNANLIAYWRLQEAAGAVADNYQGIAARDGTYVGVVLGQPGIGDGLTSPLFDGVNDWVDVNTASLVAAWNGGEFSINIWYRMSGVPPWSDGTSYAGLSFRVDASNYAWILSAGVANRMQVLYNAGATFKGVNIENVGPRTDFFSIGMTVSAGADEMQAYYNGLPEGAVLNALGVWAGALDPNSTLIGATNTGPADPHTGFIAHVSVWDAALSAAQMASAGIL